jgi:hypothetical protein
MSRARPLGMTIVVAKPKLSHSSINLPSSLSSTPAPLTAEAALDQAGQEFGAIILTRKPHVSEVAAWQLDWRQALT